LADFGGRLSAHSSLTRHIFAIKTVPVQVLVDSEAGRSTVCTGHEESKQLHRDCAFSGAGRAASGVTAPASISGVTGTFATATRDDGSKQLTYDGAPL